MNTVLNVDVLKTMSADELEDYRAAGEDFRRVLSHAVMRDLPSPSGWSANAEYRSEFGGFFPVQIRFSPLHGHFDVAVCSPGELSPWIGPYISIHFLSLNPLLVRRRRYSRGERYPSALCGCHSL